MNAPDFQVWDRGVSMPGDPSSSDPTPDSHRTMVSARDVGERIQARLDELGIDASEAARRMGMKRPGTIYEWIHGRNLPRPQEWPALLMVLKMTAEELLGIASGQEPPYAAWREFLAVLEKRGDALSPDERRALAGLPWPASKPPSVAKYELALAAVRLPS